MASFNISIVMLCKSKMLLDYCTTLIQNIHLILVTDGEYVRDGY